MTEALFAIELSSGFYNKKKNVILFIFGVLLLYNMCINNSVSNNFLDALKYTEQIQNKLEILKTEERKLNDDLAVFEIKYIHSVEIGKLQEVR